MTSSLLLMTMLCLGPTEPLASGNHTRTLESGGLKRSYLVHVPRSYDPKRPTPVVLALHGLSMSGPVMAYFTGLDQHADKEGFVVVYPNGTGPVDILRGWNAGAFPGDSSNERPDDVAFLGKVLDDIESVLTVDTKRVYVTGMSNGAMMAYRLAAAIPERIAAIAPVAGTMPAMLGGGEPKRAVPVVHFHGTADPLVPFQGVKKDNAFLKVKSVAETVETCARRNGCGKEPTITELPCTRDKCKVTRKEYGGGGGPVILYEIDGGGHSWPGMHFQPPFLGESTDNINANEVMWEFFSKHARR